MSTKEKEYSVQELVTLMVALIRAVDGDLVNKRSCFPCPIETHDKYKKIRDFFEKIYKDSEYIKSESFRQEVIGKSDQYIAMKEKYYSEPVRKNKYKTNLLESLKNILNLDLAENIVSIDLKTELIMSKQILEELKVGNSINA